MKKNCVSTIAKVASYLLMMALCLSPAMVSAQKAEKKKEAKTEKVKVKGEKKVKAEQVAKKKKGAAGHPNTAKWESLFNADLSNSVKPDGVWTINEEGVMTASKDEAIWSKIDYEKFILDLEFKTESGTNSGVIVYCTDTKNWIPNSVEVQIADDYAEKWASAPDTWHCGGIFGHLAPSKTAVKKPGEWNRMTIKCVGQKISVMLNGVRVSNMDMSLWKSATKNPDGSEIPSWLNKPFASIPTKGKIGLQGKHADATIWFRNVKVKAVK